MVPLAVRQATCGDEDVDGNSDLGLVDKDEEDAEEESADSLIQ